MLKEREGAVGRCCIFEQRMFDLAQITRQFPGFVRNIAAEPPEFFKRDSSNSDDGGNDDDNKGARGA